MSDRVRRVQGLRSSGAAGVHRQARREEYDEPCLCGTGFTCTARIHEDEGDTDHAPIVVVD